MLHVEYADIDADGQYKEKHMYWYTDNSSIFQYHNEKIQKIHFIKMFKSLFSCVYLLIRAKSCHAFLLLLLTGTKNVFCFVWIVLKHRPIINCIIPTFGWGTKFDFECLYLHLKCKTWNSIQKWTHPLLLTSAFFI